MRKVSPASILVVLLLVVLWHLLYCSLGSTGKSTAEVALCVIACLIIAILIGWLAVGARRRYRERAEHREKYLAAILESSTDAIIGMDDEGIVQSWNHGAEQMLGYGADEMVGQHFRKIVPQRLQENGELARLDKELHERGSVRGHETQRVTRDGRLVTVDLTRSAIRDDTGAIIGTSAILRDTTDRKGMERRLAQAERLAAIGEIAAGLAHEIKNPLAGLQSAIQVILRGLEEDSPRQQILNEMLVQVRRVDRAVKGLLSFAQPRPPELTQCDLNVLVTEVLSLLQREPQLANVEIVSDLQEDPCRAWLDPQQLEQVFMNILLNAGQAMPDGGTLTVSSREDESFAEVRFTDTGVGMSADVRGKAFTPFFTTKQQGTGVGLSISQSIIEAHKGKIEVDGEPGQGTTFTVCLPKTKEPE